MPNIHMYLDDELILTIKSIYSTCICKSNNNGQQ